MKKVAFLTLIMLCLQILAFGGYKGDLNDDKKTDLNDAITGLRAVADLNPSVRADYTTSGVDVNGDNKIGLEEVIYVLDIAAELRLLLMGQACTAGNVTNIVSCLNAYCCETYNGCNSGSDCQTAKTCFANNDGGKDAGGMRSYQGISTCISNSGTDAYMDNFACQFIYCGNYMVLTDLEKCLIQQCPSETAACFSNPSCFAEKYCLIDKADTPTGCASKHPAGNADYDLWSGCGKAKCTTLWYNEGYSGN